MITVQCPNCGRQLRVGDRAAGKTGACPRCGSTVTVPAARAPGEASDETVTLTVLPGSGKKTATDDATPTVDLCAALAPPQSADELGRLGQYRVLGLLGRGGMGLVFRAEDVLLGRHVAVKVLRPELSADAAFRRRFLREARTAAGLDHDHIVPVYHVGQEGDTPFLVMPLLKGETLAARAARERRLALAEVLRIGREAAEGLAYAHGEGVVHRDIKPANLWLAEGTGRVRLLDFGLAHGGLGGSSVPGLATRVLGTPVYMAPEQARGEPVDGRTDLFSLGVVLYRLSVGRLPFTESDDTVATLQSVAQDEPPPPVTVCGDIPAALSDLVMHMLGKHADSRPTSARAVIDALTAINSGS